MLNLRGLMAGNRVATLLALLILFSLISVAEASDESFSPSVEVDTFPVGTSYLSWEDSENETHNSLAYYPALSNGFSTPVDNASGPYPLVMWFGDEGEEVDQYDWVGNNLASAGYLVVVLPPDWTAEQTSVQCVEAINLYFGLQGYFGNATMDSKNWGFGGHGVGAKQAATCQLLMSGDWLQYLANTSLPNAIVGLALSDVNTDVSSSSFGPSPGPGMGLYLTGSFDEMAPSESNVEVWLENHEFPWHYMSVIGANHIQYQDENDFFEGFNDGSATMTRDVQQGHAIDHILPYFDLMLKGDHTQWLNATNRETNWESPSDSDSYIDEDLTAARFLPMDYNSSDTNEWDGMNGRVVSVSTQLLHRDGSAPIGTTVSCTITEGGDWWDPADFETYGVNSTGVFTSSTVPGELSKTDCDVPTEGVPPGNRTVRVNVNWFGMPSFIDVDFYRINQEPVLANPLPNLSVPQHGFAEIPFSEIVTDPDGTSMFIEMDAHLPSTNQMHCFLKETSLRCEHTGSPEWAGTEILNLTAFDRYDTNFSIQFNLNASVFAVDDSVNQLNPLPELQLVEDGTSDTIDIRPYFMDPEGNSVHIINATCDSGLTVSWDESNLTVTPTTNWNGVATVDLWVGDLTSQPIQSLIRVNIASVADPPFLNLTTVELIEDTPIEIPLSEIGWDEDGDDLSFSITGGHPHIQVDVLTSVLRIVPSSDWSGISSEWNLTATSIDGQSTVNLELIVSEVNDPSQLTWGSISGDEEVSFTVVIYDPDDASPWTIETRWDGKLWDDAETVCIEANTNMWECAVKVSTSELLAGAHRLEVRVLENQNWSSVKVYYHTVPLSDADLGEQNLPQIPVNTQNGPFSIWVVLAIVVASVIAIIGLYMIATISNSDMEKILANEKESNSDEYDLDALEADFAELD